MIASFVIWLCCSKPGDYFSSNENEVAKERRNEIAEFFNGPPVEQFRERNTHLLPVDAELEKQANSDDFEALMQLERLELLRNPNPVSVSSSTRYLLISLP